MMVETTRQVPGKRDTWKKGRQKSESVVSDSIGHRNKGKKSFQCKKVSSKSDSGKSIGNIDNSRKYKDSSPVHPKANQHRLLQDSSHLHKEKKAKQSGISTVRQLVKKALSDSADKYFSNTIDVSATATSTNRRKKRSSSQKIPRHTVHNPKSLSIKKSQVENLSVLTNWILKVRSLTKYQKYYRYNPTTFHSSNYYSVLAPTQEYISDRQHTSPKMATTLEILKYATKKRTSLSRAIPTAASMDTEVDYPMQTEIPPQNETNPTPPDALSVESATDDRKPAAVDNNDSSEEEDSDKDDESEDSDDDIQIDILVPANALPPMQFMDANQREPWNQVPSKSDKEQRQVFAPLSSHYLPRNLPRGDTNRYVAEPTCLVIPITSK
jgi:hypothetical protein